MTEVCSTMYSPGAPPLPPGRPPELAQQVVPADFAVSQPLWRSGAQLRQHLRELVEHAALLKTVCVSELSLDFLSIFLTVMRSVTSGYKMLRI